MPDIFLTPPAGTPRPTLIRIGDGAVGEIGDLVQTIGSFDAVVVLSDTGITPIAQRVIALIPHAISIAVPSGDASKSLTQVEGIANRLLEAGCTKRTLIVTVGGGMISDLGGFLSSIFARGTACIHVPTSVLAMVDAAIGGKTAVNLAKAKNMLGTIHHPLAVLIDIDIAAAVPQKTLAEGLVEAVKIACVHDSDLFEWCETHLSDVLTRDRAALTHIITKAITLKASVVMQDENDTLARLSLNFGHTVGHAIESLSGYSLSHGESVAIGMIAEMAQVGHGEIHRVHALLTALSMPTAIPRAMTAADLWQRMKSDKKNVGGSVRASVPKSPLGDWELCTLSQGTFFEYVNG